MMTIRQLSREIRIYGEIGSTNEELNRLAEMENLEEGTVVMSEFQTSGKGYQGNRWDSEPAKNLLFSILLKPTLIPPSNVFDISRVVSLALIEVLEKQGIGAVVKWPNDILTGYGKIAGILIENSLQGKSLESSVIGVGINVNQEGFGSYKPPATSMYLEKQCHFDREILLEEFRDQLEKGYRDLISGNREAIRDAYLDRLYLFEVPARYSDGSSEFSGKIQGVQPGGELILETEGGKIRSFGFKELEYLDLPG